MESKPLMREVPFAQQEEELGDRVDSFKEAAKALLATLGEACADNESCNANSTAKPTEEGGAELQPLPSFSELQRLSAFLDSNLPHLCVPPEGIEDETTTDQDDESDDEDEFFSVCGDSDIEEDDISGTLPASPNTAGAVCFEQRQAALPMGEGKHTWRSSKESDFDVRSETYLKNRKKMPSGKAMFEAVNIDVVKVGPEGPAWRVGKHKDFFPAYARARGDKRFFIVVNWVLPPYQAVLVGAVNFDAEWLQGDTPQARLWRRFLEMSEQERNDLFKVTISIDEGPWILKRAAPKKPVLIARKVKTRTFHEPNDHVEFVMDIATSKTEQTIVGMVMKALRGLQISLALSLEARHEDELPEQLLFCGAAKYIDPSKCGYPEVDSEWHQRPGPI